jgi:emfourin
MKIVFETSGGFVFIPALGKPVTIDTTQIDPTAARELESLIRDARFFDQPAHAPPPPSGAADYQTYTITVQDGPREHTIELTDPIADPTIARLVVALQALSRPVS